MKRTLRAVTMPLVLLAALAAGGCRPSTTGEESPPEPGNLPGVVQGGGGVFLLENHDAASIVWHALGIRQSTVVHVDAHDDLLSVEEGKLERLNDLLEKRDFEEVHRLGDYRFIDRFRVTDEERILHEGNFLYPSILDGTISTLIWVVPDRVLDEDAKERLKDHLRASLKIEGPGLFEERPEGFSLAFRQARIIVTTLEGLPVMPPGTLLDIDTDFFAYGEAMSPRRATVELPRDPDAVYGVLRDRVPDPEVVTVSYSVFGRYLPLDLRFLGKAFFMAFTEGTYPEDARRLLAATVDFRTGKAGEETFSGREGSAFEGGWHHLAGKYYWAEKKLEQSLAEISGAADADEAYVLGFLESAASGLASGRYRDSLAMVDRFEERIQGESMDSAWQRGMALVATGDIAAADQLSIRLLSRARTWPALNLRGRVLLGKGDREEARLLFEEAFRLEQNPESSYRLGWISLKEGDREGAEEHWLTTIRLAPLYEQAQYNLGLLYLETNRPGQALTHFQVAVQRSPSGPEVWNNLGVAYAALGRTAEAREAFRKALEVSPEYPSARDNLHLLTKER